MSHKVFAILFFLTGSLIFGSGLTPLSSILNVVSANSRAQNVTSPQIYYVDPTAGNDANTGLSENEAFQTTQKAVSVTQPGDTVYFMNGTYIHPGSSTASLNIMRSGTPDKWITYKAYPGHSPLIQSNGAWQAIRIDANYIIVDGFRVRGFRDQVPFDEAEAAHIDFQNGGGLVTHIHNSGISTRAFNIVRNNEVFGFGGGGIEVVEDSVIIENNTVYDNGHYSPVGHSGISVYEPVNVDGTNIGLEGDKYKIIVRGNISHSNYNLFTCSCLAFAKVTDGNGIIVDKTGDYANWILVANNIVFNNGGSGIHAYQASNVDIVNNASYHNAQHPDTQGEIYSRRSNNINIINNVMYAQEDKTVTSLHPGNNITYDYNVYYDGGNSADVPTIRGPHDIVADPMYVNPTLDPDTISLQLLPGSPALHNGSSAFLPMDDFTGIARISGQVDRGAYEITEGYVPATPTPEEPCGPLVQEAESGDLGGAWRLGINPSASNEQFIYAPSAELQINPTEVDLHQATYCFNVPANDTYRILVWGNSTGRAEDTLLVTMDGALTNGYLWQMPAVFDFNASYITAQNQAVAAEFSLTAGNHTVRFYSGNDGPILDKVELISVANSGSPAQVPPTFTPTPTPTLTPTVTPTPTITPTPSPTPVPMAVCSDLFQEAEFGLLSGGFVVEADPAASDGAFVQVPNNGGGSGSGPNESSAEYCFNVSQAGTYHIRARVMAPDGQSDSFWMQVNDEPANAYRWSLSSENDSYYVDEAIEVSGSNGPLTIVVDAPGTQIVTVYVREDGARLDTIELVPVSLVSAPGQVAQIAPNSPTTDSSPTLRWYSEPQATDYEVVIYNDGTDQIVFQEFFTAAEASCADDGICSIQPPIVLPSGPYLWLIRATNGTAFGAWSHWP